MKQIGLIKRVIEEVVSGDGMMKGKFTPSEQRPLVKDSNDKYPSGMFSYSSVVDIFLYLSGNTRPDISFAVNCCD